MNTFWGYVELRHFFQSEMLRSCQCCEICNSSNFHPFYIKTVHYDCSHIEDVQLLFCAHLIFYYILRVLNLDVITSTPPLKCLMYRKLSRDMRFPTICMCDQQSLRSACAYSQSYQSLCWSLEYSMIVKLLTEHHMEFLSFTGGCTGSSESTLVKMPHCWKSHVTAH